MMQFITSGIRGFFNRNNVAKPVPSLPANPADTVQPSSEILDPTHQYLHTLMLQSPKSLAHQAGNEPYALLGLNPSYGPPDVEDSFTRLSSLVKQQLEGNSSSAPSPDIFQQLNAKIAEKAEKAPYTLLKHLIAIARQKANLDLARVTGKLAPILPAGSSAVEY